ncbi:metallophosphoesterase [Deinococcus puniceus]|uniref:Metallophosphoesterase n=1 Tax=Deinococcus puniceus TaxID=1182568 RepID=A0A172T6N4_9DEIO|nr:metallophosphoesterase [Deinococcus puniceus]ANE42596.1 metallophosphoesterase [Deinococcus puniceus]
MQKFIAIGDVHADWDGLWGALRAASCVDMEGLPTPPVRMGLYQVILIGDLVHPKNLREYARLTGLLDFDPRNHDHLFLAAREQVKQLERLKTYQEAAPHAVHIILGNHDDAVLNTSYVLGTTGGMVHVEFDPAHGGIHLPHHLSTWIQGFPREVRIAGVQFAHVSPMPAHTYYDDLFYADHSTKRWFRESPEYVKMAGLAFGVYGHTQLEKGIYIHAEGGKRPDFAMIDALQSREYLELMLDTNARTPVQSVRAVPF